jgi:hypothetical protein
MALHVRKLKYAMSANSSTPSGHHIGVLMSPEGRFLECINCRLSFKFPTDAHYDAVAKQFESHSCDVLPPSKNNANVESASPR